jgi:hypothetical protein
MSTPKQIAASRANGAKSKGPATFQGKIVSSRNSTRHGLFAENIVLETEKTGAFLELVESLFEEHNPRTPTEKLLVEKIAAARWRQRGIWGMQKVAFDHEVASPSTPMTLPCVPAWHGEIPPKAFVLTNSSCATKSPSTARSPDPSSASSNSKPNDLNLRRRRKDVSRTGRATAARTETTRFGTSTGKCSCGTNPATY